MQMVKWLTLSFALLVWAGYIVAGRAVMGGQLSAVDLGLLRALPAALILLPFSLRRLPVLLGDWRNGAVIGLLGGAGFTYLLPLGLSYAPAADAGVFTPSMLPAFAALIAYAALGERPARWQAVGITLIIAGALTSWLADSAGGPSGAWRGRLIFLAASFCWAAYTVRARIAGLSPLESTALLTSVAALCFLLVLPFSDSGLPELSWPLLGAHILLGVAAGLGANLAFVAAIRTLGHGIPAASAALVPCMAALGGWLFLAEPVSGGQIGGIMVVSLGVLLASGVIRARR